MLDVDGLQNTTISDVILLPSKWKEYVAMPWRIDVEADADDEDDSDCDNVVESENDTEIELENESESDDLDRESELELEIESDVEKQDGTLLSFLFSLSFQQAMH